MTGVPLRRRCPPRGGCGREAGATVRPVCPGAAAGWGLAPHPSAALGLVERLSRGTAVGSGRVGSGGGPVCGGWLRVGRLWGTAVGRVGRPTHQLPRSPRRGRATATLSQTTSPRATSGLPTPDFPPPARLAYPLRLEDSPSGLGRTLGKRVGGNPSRVRISYPPPLSEGPIDQCFRWSEQHPATRRERTPLWGGSRSGSRPTVIPSRNRRGRWSGRRGAGLGYLALRTVSR